MSTERNELEAICAALPIFPLPGVVLMPGEVLPLHVFEPRYRQLLAHCLATDGMLGVATVQDGHDAAGRANIAPEIGIGRIISHQPMPDGRSNLLLRYVARARVAEELASPHAFRLVRATLAPEPVGDAGDVGYVRLLVRQIGTTNEGFREEADHLLGLPGGAMLDEIARRAIDDPDERRAYLAASTWPERANAVAAALAVVLAPDHGPVAEA